MTVAKVPGGKNGDSPQVIAAFSFLVDVFVNAVFMRFTDLAGTVPIFASYH